MRDPETSNKEAEELPNVRQQIIEKRRMKDVRLDTDYIKLGDLFNILDGLAEKLQKLLDEKSFEVNVGHVGLARTKMRVISTDWVEKVLEALKP